MNTPTSRGKGRLRCLGSGIHRPSQCCPSIWTLGHLEEIVKAYQSDCIPELFPTIHFFLGHMECIKRVRNLYAHMFPCLTKDDGKLVRREIRTLAEQINAKLRGSRRRSRAMRRRRSAAPSGSLRGLGRDSHGRILFEFSRGVFESRSFCLHAVRPHRGWLP